MSGFCDFRQGKRTITTRTFPKQKTVVQKQRRQQMSALLLFFEKFYRFQKYKFPKQILITDSCAVAARINRAEFYACLRFDHYARCRSDVGRFGGKFMT
jgi:hypothetical protein